MEKMRKVGLKRFKPMVAAQKGKVMSNSKSVKDMLMNGETMDSLIEGLKKEIIEAQKEIEAEETNSLDDVRREAIAAIFDYLEELGVIDLSEESDEEIKELLDVANDTLKKLEPKIKKYEKIINILLDVEDKKETDKPFKPTNLTKFNNKSASVIIKDVDLDAKLAKIIKGIM